MLRLYNTLTRRVDNFSPFHPPEVGMYSCGPTVYDYTHLGHLRKYTGDDILRRTLEMNGLKVKMVMNITDVGHLSEEEEARKNIGQDKFEKAAQKYGKTVWGLTEFFEDYFWKSLDAVNIKRPDIVSHATKHIPQQIKLIQELEEKGFTYQTPEAIYFDTSKFPSYTRLSGQKLEEKTVGAREEVVVDPNKKHPTDFVLWFFTAGHFKDHIMRWSSPWGEGFPGWHIECSAMSMTYLGHTLDIHTGGVDHINVHHTNEIAQSEAATGEEFVRFWVHHEFLLVNGEKMSKSKNNFYTIDDVKNKGFEPLALRYLFLTAHYRDKLNFTWESLQAAQNTLNNLRDEVREWDKPSQVDSKTWDKYLEALNNDLATPQALAIMWEMIKSDLASGEKAATLLQMDKILGLNLDKYIATPLEIPQEVKDLVEEREKVRKAGQYQEADKLRDEIQKLGFTLEDTPQGPRIKQYNLL